MIVRQKSFLLLRLDKICLDQRWFLFYFIRYLAQEFFLVFGKEIVSLLFKCDQLIVILTSNDLRALKLAWKLHKMHERVLVGMSMLGVEAG